MTRSRHRRWLRAGLAGLAIAYPLGLVGVVLLLRLAGESWWVTGLALYLPRAVFAAPLPLLVLSLAFSRRFRLLGLQAVSLLLLLFPLLGLSLSWPRNAADGELTLRVLSYNVNSVNGGFQEIAAEVRAKNPDLVFVQELPDFTAEQLKSELARHYAHVQSAKEFLVASRFPVLASVDPERLPFFGALRSPRFMKYVIATPLGPVSFFNLHTVSPRGSFYSVRGQGLRREILSGRLFAGQEARVVQETSALRALQVQAVARMAEREPGPVMIVGDTNLPTLSPVRARYLGRFQDGFAEAGSGFGYTFPAKFPWLRIDVVLATDELRFTGFEVGDSRASDHRCVVADVVLRRP